MLDLRSATFDYEPYPVGLIKPVFDEGTYQALVASYPGIELFKHKPKLGNKYSLSEVSHPAQYERFIAGAPEWKRFHAWRQGQGRPAKPPSASSPRRSADATDTRASRRGNGGAAAAGGRAAAASWPRLLAASFTC